MTKFVVKRDGRKEEFNVEKIKKVIAWAVNDLEVNALVLESKFDQFIKDEIQTDDIQNNLIHHSRSLCSPEQTDWSIVAGRLEVMKMWKEYNVFEKSFLYYVNEMKEKNLYSHPGIPKWTKNEIIKLGDEIIQERDLDHSYGSILTGKNKYLLPGECIQQMFMVNAMIIASVETKQKRLKKAIEIYHALSERKISLATPWLSNLRSNGNISSCFIIQLDDSLASISQGWKNAAKISKDGGGIGIDFSRIRAKGSAINGNPGASQGVVPWIKIYNDIAVAVNQGGKRQGAFTCHVPIWHRDIESFLSIQHENGDLRARAFDIFPQVGFHDIFMKEVLKEDGGTWHTFCPHEVNQVLGLNLHGSYGKEFNSVYKKCVNAHSKGQLKNVATYNAKELVKIIMRTQFETGMPYISFLDTINANNPNNHIGTIPCTNLCVESYSVVEADKYAHTCNLCSIVLGRIDSNEELIEIARLSTYILDNGIELTSPPIKDSEEHNNKFRTIGVGILGLHDYLAKEGIQWSDYNRITEIAELIEYGCVRESIDLAEERGKYPFFEGSTWDTGVQIQKYQKNSVSQLCDWEETSKLLGKHGIRNSQLTSPAPNSSTSIFMDATAGVIPIYSAYYNEDNKTGNFPVYGMYVKEYPLDYEQTASRQDKVHLTKVIGSLQKFVTAGISAEYLFDLNQESFSAKDLYDLIVAAWKNKTKAIYYIRSIKKGETVDAITGGEEVCVGCAG